MSDTAIASPSIIKQLLDLHTGVLAISGELDLERLLQRIVDTARQVTHSHYAALGVVGEDGLISFFYTSGISAEQREQMGELPRGHGLLGVLIKEGRPIRIPNIGADPRSVGFPPNHPPMLTLLGMPINYKGHVVGDLYLTDKVGGGLWSDTDEWLTSMLANHAASAISNAHLYKELQESREHAEADRHRLSVMLAQLPDGVVLCDATGRVTLLNVIAEQIMGFQVGDDVQQRNRAICHPDGTPYAARDLPLIRTLAEGRAHRGQQLLVTQPDGSTHDILTSTAPLFDAAGKLNGAVGVYQDITEIKSVERLKDEFFSMATHELRTPLTSIRLSSGLLAELLAAQGGKLASLSRLVDENAERMRKLVDDLLDLSRLEHHRLTLYRRRISLCAVAERTIEELAPLAERKRQQLTLNIQAAASCEVHADPGRIEQVIVNLIGNAIKYTPEGGRISIAIQTSGGETEVVVADTGPGVSLEERTHVFERFYRLKREGTNGASGTGLGLSIAKMLVELHGGRIWLEDNPAGGSMFKFTIPNEE